MSRSAFTALTALGASIVTIGCLAPAAQAQSAGCTAYAAPSGNDDAAGTISAPKRTPQALADSLNPGDTGCLRAGNYTDGVVFRSGGTATARLTLRSTPGEKATITGEVRVADSAPYVTVAGLSINGAPLNKPNPIINGSDAVFANNDVTNEHTEICFMLGNSEWGRADRALLTGNRIHDCGKLPSRNQDHGIYIAAATGVRVQNNWIYDNADRGIQLYPDAQHTTITGNIIDNNGEGIIISGEGGSSSNDTRVEGNVISNSNLRHNIESWWADDSPTPRNNVIRRNCLTGGRNATKTAVSIEKSAALTVGANLSATPGYRNRAADDLRLSPTSRCRSVFRGAPDAVAGPAGLDAPATASAARPSVTIRAVRRAVRHGQRAQLLGRVSGGRGTKVAIVQRQAGRDRVVARASTNRRGAFAAAVAVKGARAVRLRAEVPGVSRSQSVRIAVTR